MNSSTFIPFMGRTFQLLMILFFLQWSVVLRAQDFVLAGKIVSNEGTPISFANVLLLSPDQTVVSGVISEDNGMFSIANVTPGTYTIAVTFLGYQPYNAPDFVVSADKILADIVLLENAESLDEVTVLGKKPMIIRKSDRIVFNVENSIVSNGSTWDILKSTPGVIEKEGTLSVRNQSAQVYINDRKVALDGGELKDLIDGLGGGNIKAVEVILNPPAKYGADSGPIINLVSSKSKFEGYKGSVTARGTYGIFPKHYFGTSHFFKGKKLSAFINYGYNPLKETTQSDNIINYFNPAGGRDRWVTDFERKKWTKAHTANLILDYQITEKQLLSFTALGLYSPDEFNFARSLISVSPAIDTPFGIRTTSRLDSEKSNLAADLSYTYTLKNGGISANLHVTRYDKEVSQQLGSDYSDDNGLIFRSVAFNSGAEQDIEIVAGQLDYETTLNTVDLEIGAKISTINSRSSLGFSNIQNDAQNGLSDAQNDDFLYDETVYAGYISASKDWKKWSVKVGLRIEQTESLGNSLVLNQQVHLNYLEWFPSAYIQYKPSENHGWSLDYGRKLERPQYQDLNPFAYFINENNFNTGNSGLLPSFGNNFNLNYSLKNKYFFDLYYRDNGENIVRLPFQDNVNQVLRTETQNARGSKSWGIDFTHARSITKWWYFYTYLSVFHEENTFLGVESNTAVVTNNVDGFYLSGYNYITLSKDKTWKAEASVAYFSNFISGSYIQDATTDATIGIKKTFWKDKASLSITANDLLGEANAILRTRYLNQDNSYFPIPETQNVRIRFTYNFGNFKLKDNNRAIDSKERDRIGN